MAIGSGSTSQGALLELLELCNERDEITGVAGAAVECDCEVSVNFPKLLAGVTVDPVKSINFPKLLSNCFRQPNAGGSTATERCVITGVRRKPSALTEGTNITAAEHS